MLRKVIQLHGFNYNNETSVQVSSQHRKVGTHMQIKHGPNTPTLVAAPPTSSFLTLGKLISLETFAHLKCRALYSFSCPRGAYMLES